MKMLTHAFFLFLPIAVNLFITAANLIYSLKCKQAMDAELAAAKQLRDEIRR